jgi:enediyne biosynthesis protein E4
VRRQFRALACAVVGLLAAAFLCHEVAGRPVSVLELPVGVEMVFVPPASFLMGTRAADLDELTATLQPHGSGRTIRRQWFEDETPQRVVSLSAFYIDKYEVTNAAYAEFLEDSGRPAPAFWADARLRADENPVVGVSWDDASAYAEWAGKSLPTEAQWERVARDGQAGRAYPWGDGWPPPHGSGNYGAGVVDGYDDTAAPVGSFPPNGLGVYDLAGNVAEWCLDAYHDEYYGGAPAADPVSQAPDGVRVLRVVRGGGWSGTAITLRSAYRGRDVPDGRYDFVGFRCALNLGVSGRDEPPSSPTGAQTEPLPAPIASSRPSAPTASLAPLFTDVTVDAGIQFTHVAGLSDSKHLPETMGSGAAFFDADGDGDMDLYIVNSGGLDDSPQADRGGNALYRNDGDGTFTDITAAAGVGDTGYGMGVSAADYDGDGSTDLYVTNYGPNVLFRSNGDGTFGRATDAGVAGAEWSVSSAFADVDADGDLDLYVVNYVTYDLAMEPCLDPDTGLLEYCHPRFYQAESDVLYRNEGDGTFVDVSREAGIGNAIEGKGLGVAACDYDNDGWVDIYVANDTTRNFLYRNQGDGTFLDVALAAGVGYNSAGLPEGGMGVDFGDYNGDGSMDLFVTNSSAETNTLYRNNGDGSFTDVTALAGLAEDSLAMLAFGTAFVDIDNDMDLDIFVANGGLQPNVAELSSGVATYAQRDQLYTNDGSGRYTAHPGPATGAFVGRGAAFADYDDDGDVDVYVANSAQRGRLLRNDAPAAGGWLRVELIGQGANTAGIGARVVVDVGGRLQVREARSGSSYASSSDPRLLFGLGAATRVDRVAVRWPDGSVQWAPGAKANGAIRVTHARQ